MVERSPSGRATHERSQSSLSPPTVGIPNAEAGFVEYRSLWHALWKEGLSVVRSWRHASTNERGIQQWYGVYVSGTELRLASVGPWQIDRAIHIASGMEARQGQDAEERLDAKHDSPPGRPNSIGGSNVTRD
jgi:hypothetical protein